MKNIEIGTSGVSASAIAMGCMRISNLTLSEAEKLVDTALNAGINMFDHADIYGGGRCEEIFGQLFKETPSMRSKMLLQSKCGIRKGYYDLSREHILNAADGILKRLNTDYIDFLLLHRPDTLMEPHEIARAFSELKAAGKVLHFGVSNMNPAQINLIQAEVKEPLAVNQMQLSAARSGLIASGINVNVPAEHGESRDCSVLEYCRAKNITIQAWSPLQHGFFGGVFLNHEGYPLLNKVLNELAEKYSCTPSAIALAWILRHPASIQVITGSQNPQHLEEMARAGSITLTRPEWYEIYKAAGNTLP